MLTDASCWPIQHVLEYPSETTLVKAWRCQDLNAHSLPNSRRYFVAPTIVVVAPSNRLSATKGAVDRVQDLMSVALDALTFDGTTGSLAGGHPSRDRLTCLCLATVSFSRYERSPHLGHLQTFCGFFWSPDLPRFENPNTEMPGLQHFERHGCSRVEML